MAIVLFSKKHEHREHLFLQQKQEMRLEVIKTDIGNEDLEEAVCKLVSKLNKRGRIIKQIAYNKKDSELYFVTKIAYENFENRVYTEKLYDSLQFPWRKQFEFEVKPKGKKLNHFVFWEKPLRKPY